MKNLIFFFITYLFSANRIYISEKHVSLHKGRLLPIEEGYNEKIENIRFLKQLDSIDVLLDDFERDLLDTRQKSFKEIDELTGKMTNEHNIHTLSKFIKKKVSQDNFKEVIQKAMNQKKEKLDELIIIRDKLKNLSDNKSKKEQTSLDLKNFDPQNIDKIQKLLENLKEKKQIFNLKIEFPKDKKERKLLGNKKTEVIPKKANFVKIKNILKNSDDENNIKINKI